MITMTKRVALVQPRITAGKSLGIEKSPESIQALAGQLEKEGFTVKMFHEKAEDGLYNKIKDFNPDSVGISTMTVNFPDGKKVAKAVKNIDSDIPVILGGWHASGVVQAYLKGQENETIEEVLNPKSPFDYIVAGEGELIFPELIRRIEKGQKVDGLKGVGFLKDKKIIISRPERIKNLDDLAFPSWGGLPIDDYRDKRDGSLDLSVHFNRACRFDCGFCSTGTVYGKGVKTVNAERAADYVESLLERFMPEVITFTDEDFFANPKWVAEIVEIFNKREFKEKYNIRFDTFASINDILRLEKETESIERSIFSSEIMGFRNYKPEVISDEIKKAGFNSFTIGIESFNPKILRKYNKEMMILPTMTQELRELYHLLFGKQEYQDYWLVRHYLNSAQRAIDFAHKRGFVVVGDYMVGNLGETEKQVRKGFERFSNLRNLHVAYLPIFTPFPGTELWYESYHSGKLARDKKGNIDWAKFDGSAGALDLGYDIKELRNQLELEFYTSQRYKEDMYEEIQGNPTKKTMFQKRFEYLNRTFPGNELVEETLRALDKST